MPTLAIELNADVGELPGPEGRASDREMLSAVSAANIACGAHAGDEATIEATLRACRELGVVAGAHPGYPDREGFGRRRGALGPPEIRDSVREQLALYQRVAQRLRMPVARVKAHGALYNEASVDRGIADALLAGISEAMPGATVVALAKSAFARWARDNGFRVIDEGFADRGYGPDGALVPRGEPGALIHDPEVIAQRVLRLLNERKLAAADGTDLTLHVATLCLHGDAPGAAGRARTLRIALERAGVEIRAVA